MTFLIIWWGFVLFLWAVCGYAFWRNHKIYKLRMSMISEIFKYIDYSWRVDEYNKVSYDDMMKQFWKFPVEAKTFYKDTSFLEPSNKPVKSFIQVVPQE